MRVVLTTSIPGGNIVSIGLGGLEELYVPLYVNTSMYWYARPLCEHIYLLAGKKVTVPLMAAVCPREWRMLLSLAAFTQEKAPGPNMSFPPDPRILPMAVASVGEYMAGSVAVWADPLDRDLLLKMVAAGLESGVEELWLVYIYSVPQLMGDLEIGDTAAAYYFLKRHFPRMTDRVNYRLEEKSLKFREHMKNYKRLWLCRCKEIDLLELAFGEQARLARDLLQDVVENGGAITLKSLLDFVREEGLRGIFDRLLDYGYLRLAGIPPQVTITEKGLYALK